MDPADAVLLLSCFSPVYRSAIRVSPHRSAPHQPTVCPEKTWPNGAEFPIHAEPSNNIKLPAQGQAANGENPRPPHTIRPAHKQPAAGWPILRVSEGWVAVRSDPEAVILSGVPLCGTHSRDPDRFHATTTVRTILPQCLSVPHPHTPASIVSTAQPC